MNLYAVPAKHYDASREAWKVRVDFMIESEEDGDRILQTTGGIVPTEEAADAQLEQLTTALNALAVDIRERVT